MSKSQRIIRNLAIAFAIFLIITIFTTITTIGYNILKATNIVNSTTKSSVDHSKYETYLDINLKTSNLKIVTGEMLSVNSTNKKIYVEQNTNQLLITDSRNIKIFSNNKEEEIVVTIPENFTYDIVSINTGAGKVDIDGLSANKLNLDIGAGNLKIKNSILKDTKFDLGVGKIKIDARLIGNNKINCGIGAVDLKLRDSIETYTFDVEKGIGSISLNGQKVTDDEKIGNGAYNIEIDGGIGSIDIYTN